jgi:phosphoglucosamine mutase
MVHNEINTALGDITAEINGKGRILLRKSGTEPVIRIMAECVSEEKCNEYINTLSEIMKRKGYTVE